MPSGREHRASFSLNWLLLGSLRLLGTCCLLLVALLAAVPAWAQLRVAPPSDALTAGQSVNAFVQWNGTEAIEGFRVEVPEGWAVQAAQVVSDGSMALGELHVAARGGGDYDLDAAQPLRGGHLIVVRLQVGDRLGYQTVALAPRLGPETVDTWREEWPVYVREPASAWQNRAFHLSEEAEPLALRRSTLPGLGQRDPFTIEFWIKTVGLHEVVLSTWDGDEERPYPLEIVVDTRGRLVFYRGRPGRHVSAASSGPVADGQWHHVALANDPFAGWTRLLVDGVKADSLRIDEALGVLNTMSLVLGGRPERPGTPRRRVFSGMLDELRLWNAARPATMIRRAMRVPLEDMPKGSLRFSFDTPLPTDRLVRVPENVVRVSSDLSFAFPVEALEASSESGIVTLTWQTKDRQAEEFRVERSTDGQRFETVGTVQAAEHVSERADGSARFAYTDLPPSGQVLYYRIRQVEPDGPERVSGALKLGLGAGEAAEVAIVGNSPNPFRDRTTISYDLAQSQPVTLSVWDVSGTRVAVLVDETQPAGRHEFRFVADGLPSGVYFVRLETPDGNAVHKMTLTR